MINIVPIFFSLLFLTSCITPFAGKNNENISYTFDTPSNGKDFTFSEIDEDDEADGEEGISWVN